MVKNLQIWALEWTLLALWGVLLEAKEEEEEDQEWHLLPI